MPDPYDWMDVTRNLKKNSTPHFDESRQNWRSGEVHVTAGDLREVNIAGCTPRVIGVDVAETVDARTTVVHFLYFPDLRFGTRTRITFQDGRKVAAGVSSLTALQ